MDGINWAKWCQVLHKILVNDDIAVIAIQEIYTESED